MDEMELRRERGDAHAMKGCSSALRAPTSDVFDASGRPKPKP